MVLQWQSWTCSRTWGWSRQWLTLEKLRCLLSAPDKETCSISSLDLWSSFLFPWKGATEQLICRDYKATSVIWSKEEKALSPSFFFRVEVWRRRGRTHRCRDLSLSVFTMWTHPKLEALSLSLLVFTMWTRPKLEELSLYECVTYPSLNKMLARILLWALNSKNITKFACVHMKQCLCSCPLSPNKHLVWMNR